MLCLLTCEMGIIIEPTPELWKLNELTHAQCIEAFQAHGTALVHEGMASQEAGMGKPEHWGLALTSAHYGWEFPTFFSEALET